MPILDTETCRTRLSGADHAVLATVGTDGSPHSVPVCFVVLDDVVVVPVDTVKPKSTTALRRSANVATSGRASLLVERWDPDDWSQLWWVRADLVTIDLPDEARGRAADALRDRYVQYREATFADLLSLRIDRLSGWSAAAG